MEGTCSIEGCNRSAKARGWCSAHYERWRNHGDPLVVDFIIGDDAARFWSHVEKTDTCWLWTGALTGNGYGQIRLKDGSRHGVHRFAYELVVGPIPDGLYLDHICRVRNCVRPSHLEPVTPGENLLRSPLTNSGKTHCKWGHRFDEHNTYHRPSGGRGCLTCNRERLARSRAARVQHRTVTARIFLPSTRK